MRQEVFEGQCQCGAIDYRATGVALTIFACHCTEWIRNMPSGKQMSCQFCPDCGTRLFHKVVGQDLVLSIKPGTFDALMAAWANADFHAPAITLPTGKDAGANNTVGNTD